MLVENNYRMSTIRCVSCGKYILPKVIGRYEGNVTCNTCGTRFHIDLDRTDLIIEYDDNDYRERHH